MKKKILFIHHCGTKSGAANSLITLIEHLDKDRFECYVMCPIGSAYSAFEAVATKVYPSPELPEIVSISGYPNNYLRLFKALLLYNNLTKAIKTVNEINPDLVHLNEVSLSLLAKQLKKNGRIVVMHARLVLDHKTTLLNKFIINNVNKYTDHVICIDESVRKLLQGVHNATLVYNSYQFENTEFENKPVAANDKFVVLFLANLIKYKGVFDLLEAAKLIKPDSGIEIQIAGGNSRSDEFFKSPKGKILQFLGLAKDNRSILQEQIDKNDLDKIIKLIGNIKNIKEKIIESSVNIFPSYMNGPSRSIFEAGVLGRPSIIALHDKMNDVVEDGKTGLVIDEGNPKQIADAIINIKNDKNLLTQMGQNAKDKYLILNNPVLNAKRVENVYDKLLKDNKFNE